MIVGFGGYVALPAYLAARRARLPIVVHEANARPGVANRLAARLTHHVYTASEQVRLPHARADRHSAAAGDLQPRSGGDAAACTERVRAAARRADPAGHRRLAGRAVAQPGLRRSGGRPSPGGGAGAAHRRRQEHRWRCHRGSRRTWWFPSSSRCIYAYAAADFVLCRCGAMTCAELSAVGLPAAYVPYPLRERRAAVQRRADRRRRAAACSSRTRR